MSEEDSAEIARVGRGGRKRNPEQSRRRILDAAQRAFALRGFAGARLRDIAQEAGVHHALVHHYYGDKRGLFHQVIKRGLGRISTAGLRSLDQRPDPAGAVRAFVGVTFDFCANNGDLLCIIEGAFRDRDSLAHEVAEQSLGAIAAPLMDTLRRRITEARERGMMRRDISVDALLGLGMGAIMYRFIAADGLTHAMGLRSKNDLDLAVEREACIQFILGAMGVVER